MQDITPGHKRSIRDIPIPERRKRPLEQHVETEADSFAEGEVDVFGNLYTEDTPYNEETYQAQSVPPMYVRNKHSENIFISRWRIWGVALLALVVAIFAISFIFEGATITVTPKTQLLSVDTRVVAMKNSTNSDDVRYDIIELNETASRMVESTGNVVATSTKAKGTITVFNRHSSEPFALVTQTRFESPDGMIYRIQEAIEIPGRKGETPGQKDVEIVADDFGSSYNIDGVDFTVPGLKGSEAFEGIYGRTKGSISGGALASESVIPNDQREKIEEELEKQVESALLARVKTENPDGYIFLKSLYDITYSHNIEKKEGNQVELTVRGTIQAAILEEQALVKKIAGNIEPNQNGDIPKVSIGDVEKLFALRTSGSLDPSSEEDITMSLSGNPTLVWMIDNNKLIADLSGVAKKRVEVLLQQHDAVQEAEVVLRPIWKRSLPENEADIKVVNTFYDK